MKPTCRSWTRASQKQKNNPFVGFSGVGEGTTDEQPYSACSSNPVVDGEGLSLSVQDSIYAPRMRRNEPIGTQTDGRLVAVINEKHYQHWYLVLLPTT